MRRRLNFTFALRNLRDLGASAVKTENSFTAEDAEYAEVVQRTKPEPYLQGEIIDTIPAFH